MCENPQAAGKHAAGRAYETLRLLTMTASASGELTASSPRPSLH